jgi:hypothetical protein
MTKRILGVALAGALAMSVAGAVPAMARGGNDDVIKRGACSRSSDWKLKLSPDDGRIEVEYEVDSNVAGQTWNVKLFENGNQIFGGRRQTQGASGSFSVRVLARNTAGTDSFRASATNVANGETCAGTASI